MARETSPIIVVEKVAASNGAKVLQGPRENVETTRYPAWQRRKAFRKVEILAAAVEVLNEVGVDGMSMLGIASRASVSEATVYKYFESKASLLDQAILSALQPNIEYLEQEIPLISGCELKLKFFIARSMATMGQRPMLNKAIYGELRWIKRNQTLHGLHRRIGKIVRDIFQTGIDDGELQPLIDIVLAGDMVFGGIASTGWRTLLAGREIKGGIDAFAARFARQLISGLRIHERAESSVLSRLESLVYRMERAAASQVSLPA